MMLIITAQVVMNINIIGLIISQTHMISRKLVAGGEKTSIVKGHLIPKLRSILLHGFKVRVHNPKIIIACFTFRIK